MTLHVDLKFMDHLYHFSFPKLMTLVRRAELLLQSKLALSFVRHGKRKYTEKFPFIGPSKDNLVQGKTLLKKKNEN